MYGANSVAHAEHNADGALNVNSIFYTIQGEGPDAGRPAIFLRLQRCNLRCHFCDTEFERGERQELEQVASAVTRLARENDCDLVVITGGEPLLQNIVPLVIMLNAVHIVVSVETAGTVYVPGLEHLFASGVWKGNLIVCSPKTPGLNEQLLPLIGALKYVVKAGEMDPDDGLPIMSTQLEGQSARIYRPSTIIRCTVPIFLQPCDENDPIANMENIKAAAAACMKHGYRLSIQTHKIAGLP